MGTFKCNLDASFHKAQNRTGMDMCIRDGEGLFIAARIEFYTHPLRVHEGEALCLLHALSWVSFTGLVRVCFEMDNKFVVDSIHNHRDNLAEFGTILSSCKQILQSHQNF